MVNSVTGTVIINDLWGHMLGESELQLIWDEHTVFVPEFIFNSSRARFKEAFLYSYDKNISLIDSVSRQFSGSFSGNKDRPPCRVTL